MYCGRWIEDEGRGIRVCCNYRWMSDGGLKDLIMSCCTGL